MASGSLPSGTDIEARPRVILDVQFEEGVFSVALANIGDLPATEVSVTLDKKISGLGGAREINGLRIMKEVTFLPPRKTITFLLDSASSYFARKEPTRFTATITYSDGAGGSYADEMTHDLEVYRDLPYRVREEARTSS